MNRNYKDKTLDLQQMPSYEEAEFYPQDEENPQEYYPEDDYSQDPDIEGEYDLRREADHFENLADHMEENDLGTLAQDLIQGIQDDDDSREEWKEQIALSYDYLGLRYEDMTFPFPQACGAYSHVFLQSVINFQSEASVHLLPPEGPCKYFIDGESNEELETAGEKIENFGNKFLLDMRENYYSDKNKLFFMVVKDGCAFTEVFVDSVDGVPNVSLIQAKDFIVHNETIHLSSCPRMTKVYNVTRKDLMLRMMSGEFRDIKTIPLFNDGQQSSIAQAESRAMGLRSDVYDDNTNVYQIYECHADLDLSQYQFRKPMDPMEMDAQLPIPYIVTISKSDDTILSVRRNYRKGDAQFRKIPRFIKYSYVEGPWFYSLGASQILNNNSIMSTDLMRKIADAGTLANFPGGLISSSFRFNENNIRIGPTEFKQVETGNLPIDNAIKFMPYRDPSPVLMDLKDKVDKSAASIMGTTNIPIEQLSGNTPVGTMYAYLNEANIPKSNPMRNLHFALQREFALLFELFAETLPDQPMDFLGRGENGSISKYDFLDNQNVIKLIPVADINVSSSMQQLMRSQAVLDIAQKFPNLHNMYQVVKRMYRDMKVGNIDEILPPPEEPKPLDSISENMKLMTGKGAQAFIFQDHDAHNVTHQALLNDPSMDPAMQRQVMEHMHQHNAFKFLLTMQQQMGVELPPELEKLPPEMQNQISALAAQATMQMGQQQQEQLPPPPIDPSIPLLEDVKVRDKKVDLDAQIAQMKADVDIYKVDEKNKFDLLKEQIKAENNTKDLKTEIEGLKDLIVTLRDELHHRNPELIGDVNG